MLRQDYFERLIEQLVGAIARVAGLADQGKYEEASREIEGCYRSLGVTRDMLGRLEPATLAAMLGREKGEAVARVLDAEALLLRAQGQDAQAVAKSHDADGIRRAVAK